MQAGGSNNNGIQDPKPVLTYRGSERRPRSFSWAAYGSFLFSLLMMPCSWATIASMVHIEVHEAILGVRLPAIVLIGGPALSLILCGLAAVTVGRRKQDGLPIALVGCLLSVIWLVIGWVLLTAPL